MAIDESLFADIFTAPAPVAPESIAEAAVPQIDPAPPAISQTAQAPQGLSFENFIDTPAPVASPPQESQIFDLNPQGGKKVDFGVTSKAIDVGTEPGFFEESRSKLAEVVEGLPSSVKALVGTAEVGAQMLSGFVSMIGALPVATLDAILKDDARKFDDKFKELVEAGTIDPKTALGKQLLAGVNNLLGPPIEAYIGAVDRYIAFKDRQDFLNGKPRQSEARRKVLEVVLKGFPMLLGIGKKGVKGKSDIVLEKSSPVSSKEAVKLNKGLEKAEGNVSVLDAETSLKVVKDRLKKANKEGTVNRQESQFLKKRLEKIEKQFDVAPPDSPFRKIVSEIKEELKSIFEKKDKPAVPKAGKPTEAPVARSQPVDPVVRKKNLSKNIDDRIEAISKKKKENPSGDVSADIASLASAQQILNTLEGKGPVPRQSEVFNEPKPKPPPLEADPIVETRLQRGTNKQGKREVDLDKGEKIAEKIPKRPEGPINLEAEPTLKSQSAASPKPVNVRTQEEFAKEPKPIPEKPVSDKQNPVVDQKTPEVTEVDASKPSESATNQQVNVGKEQVTAVEKKPDLEVAVQRQVEAKPAPEPEPRPPDIKIDKQPLKKATKQPVPAITGKRGKFIRLNKKPVTGTYGVIQGGKFIGSHDALNDWKVNPRYPKGVQDRDYNPKNIARAKVGATPEGFDAFMDTYLQPDVTALTGPANMLSDGRSVHGTGRNGTIDLILQDPVLRGKYLKRLESALVENFGFSEKDAKRAVNVKNPKLVLIYDEYPKTIGDLKNLSRNKEQGFAKSTSAGEDARDFAGQISDERIVEIGQMFAKLKKRPEDSPSMAQVLERFGKEIVDSFVLDGAITQGEVDAFLTETLKGGKTVVKVSEQGKISIKNALVSRLIDDPFLIARMTPQLDQLALRIIPEMTKMRAAATKLDPTNNDISAHIIGAFKATIDAKNTNNPLTGKKVTPDEYLQLARENEVSGQTGFFKETVNKSDVIGKGEVIFRLLMGRPKPSFKDRLAEYTAGLDDIVSGQTALFADKKSAVELFEDIMGEIPPLPAGSEKSGMLGMLDNERGSFDFRKFRGKKAETPEEKLLREAFEESDIYKANMADVAEKKRMTEITGKKVWGFTQKQFFDRSGPMETQILESGGDFGQSVIIKKHLARGSNTMAMMEVQKVERDIFAQLTPQEMGYLQTAVNARRDFAFAEYRDDVRNPHGIEAEDSLAQLDKIREKAGEGFARINGFADKYFAATRKILEDSLEAGFLDQKQFDLLSQTKDYARREFLDFLDPEVTYNVGRGKNISLTSNGISRLKQGSDGALDRDIQLMIHKMITSFHSRAFNNRANVRAAQFAKEVPDNGVFKVTKKGEPDPKRHTEVDFWVKGKKQKLWVNWDYAEQYVSQEPMLKHEIAQLTQWLSGSPILRASATAFNPAFPITNVPRDLIFTYFRSREFSPHLPIYMGEIGKDLAATFKYLQTPKQFINDEFGGFAKQMVERGMVVNFLTTEGMPGLVNLHPKLRAFGKYIEWAGFTSEIWIRYAIALRAAKNQMAKHIKKHGSPPTKGSEAMNDIMDYAAHAGRSYIDFDGGGTFIKGMNNAATYLNAGFIAMEGMRKSAFGPIPGQKKIGGVNTDFMVKSAWIAGLAGSFWLYQQKDENGRELMKRLSSYEKSANLITGLPFLNQVDKDGATRYAYLRIAKSQEARPIMTLFEGIFSRIAAEKLRAEGKPYKHLMPNGDEMVEAAKSSMSLIPGSSMLPPNANALMSYFANFDTWRQENVWDPRDGKEVEGRAKVDFRTNPMLALMADTEIGRAADLSPVNAQAAIAKLLVPNNPLVMGMGAALEQMAIAMGAEENPASIKREFVDIMNYHIPFLNRMIRYSGTKETAQTREGDELEKKINTDRRLNRNILDRMLAEEEESEDKTQVKDFIKSLPERGERDKLKVRAKRVRKIRKKSDKRPLKFIRQFGELRATSDPIARAGRAAILMRDMDDADRKQFKRDMKHFGSIRSDSFDKELRKIFKAE